MSPSLSRRIRVSQVGIEPICQSRFQAVHIIVFDRFFNLIDLILGFRQILLSLIRLSVIHHHNVLTIDISMSHMLKQSQHNAIMFFLQSKHNCRTATIIKSPDICVMLNKAFRNSGIAKPCSLEQRSPSILIRHVHIRRMIQKRIYGRNRSQFNSTMQRGHAQRILCINERTGLQQTRCINSISGATSREQQSITFLRIGRNRRFLFCKQVLDKHTGQNQDQDGHQSIHLMVRFFNQSLLDSIFFTRQRILHQLGTFFFDNALEIFSRYRFIASTFRFFQE